MAMQASKQLGYSAVEFDVMLSSDGLPVLMHDENLGRTVPGMGRACDLTRVELMSMDAANGNVPSFDNVLIFCKENDIWMNIEIKPATGQEVSTELSQLDVHYAAFDYVAIAASLAALPLISSFSYDSLVAAREEAPNIPRAFLVDDLNSKESQNWRAQLEEIGAVAVHTNHANMTEELAAEIRALGYALFFYTVNTKEECERALILGVDTICTDTLSSSHNLTLLESKA
eukprot:GSChrysophyteH1.ASY1.ANO1.2761.1 assembled CDS